MRILLVFGPLLLMILAEVGAATLTGRVLRVSDGDTLVVLGPGGAHYTVDLAGAVAPRPDQPYGEAARQRLNERAAGRFVVVDYRDRRDASHLVGRAMVGRQDLGLDQISSGLAWYREVDSSILSSKEQETYKKAMEQARRVRRGLWHIEDPTPPWRERQQFRCIPPSQWPPGPPGQDE